MPKIVELTVEICIERVSCPGVWLCQDGRVSLSIFALGTNYQTCLLPPVFPLMFKDVLYFRKRFQETCALNNICCLLKDETIFCELVQWSEDCGNEKCIILAQYLGALNDVLFPPNMCSSEGVDLLMRRTKKFPGILSPKIEISTKVRIDEVWNQKYVSQVKATSCHCAEGEKRQRQVCHTSQYHRNKCYNVNKRYPSLPRSHSQSRSESSRSCVSFKEQEEHPTCKCPNSTPTPRCRHSRARWPHSAGRQHFCRNYGSNVETGDVAWITNRTEDEYQEKKCINRNYSTSPPCSHSPHLSPKRRSCSPSHPRQYSVYNVEMEDVTETPRPKENIRARPTSADSKDDSPLDTEKMYSEDEERIKKIILESRYIEDDINESLKSILNERKTRNKVIYKPSIRPCICEICKRYHELFHTEKSHC